MKSILTGAEFFRNEKSDRKINSVLIENGKIEALFYDEKSLPSGIKKINLKDKFVTAGCVDSHTHSFEGGLYAMGSNLCEVKSVSEVLEKMKGECREDFVFAYSYDENKVAEKRFPTREELDSVFPDKPVLLRRIDGHSCVINSFAASKIDKLSRKSSDWNGLLTKEENDVAAHWFHKSLPDEMILKAYKRAEKSAIEAGLTSVHAMVGDADMSLTHFKIIQKYLSDFDVKYKLYPQSFNISEAEKTDCGRIGGCILADGSIGSKTAALFKPYKDSDERGILYQTDEFWYEFIKKSHLKNMQVAVHAIGDRAIDQILRQYEKVHEKYPKKIIHQIIHCELTREDHIRRMAEAGVAVAVQPMFDGLWGQKNGFYEKKLGVETAARMNLFKDMVNAGILVCGSSDWYITTLDIRKQLSALMNHNKESQRFTFSEALKLYTENPAKLIGKSDTAGRIKVGYDADFTVFSKSPLNTDIEKDVKIDGVFASGKFLKA
ncbi:MAG: hypothetical protein CSB55_00750 [Candidatus Cloacimonadota bacterium]|nr:MAG: hypothetical protein CSB55_00750 [Candidatus Cloacimonadota bacterium]